MEAVAQGYGGSGVTQRESYIRESARDTATPSPAEPHFAASTVKALKEKLARDREEEIRRCG